MADSRGEDEQPLPRIRPGSVRGDAGGAPGGAASRSASLGARTQVSDDGDALPAGGRSQRPLSSSRAGAAEHRADPALRSALEVLDTARLRQPAADDFAIERFLGSQRFSGQRSTSKPGVPPSPVPEEQAAAGALGQGHCFSLDMLLAALPARAAAARLQPPVDLSRSTSPGSTQASSFSGGSAASGKSKHAGLPGGPELGDHRQDGHAEAFVPVAPAGPRPTRKPPAPRQRNSSAAARAAPLTSRPSSARRRQAASPGFRPEWTNDTTLAHSAR